MLEEIDKKKTTIVLGVFVVLVSVAAFIIFQALAPKPTVSVDERYVDVNDAGEYVIPVSRLTENRVEEITSDADYTFKDWDNRVDNAFNIRGSLNGEIFYKTALYDEKDRIAVAITPELDPTNYIAEAFIVWDLVDGQPTAYIYADEEWRNIMEEAWIIWGSEYQHAKLFEWTPVADGLYMNIIEDDWSRFSAEFHEAKGGIVLGNKMTQPELLEDDAFFIILL